MISYRDMSIAMLEENLAEVRQEDYRGYVAHALGQCYEYAEALDLTAFLQNKESKRLRTAPDGENREESANVFSLR